MTTKTLQASNTETVHLHCDQCGDRLTFEINPKDRRYVSDVASNFGWTYHKGKYMCNSCKEEY
jgi:hypothetical protein